MENLSGNIAAERTLQHHRCFLTRLFNHSFSSLLFKHSHGENLAEELLYLDDGFRLLTSKPQRKISSGNALDCDNVKDVDLEMYLAHEASPDTLDLGCSNRFLEEGFPDGDAPYKSLEACNTPQHSREAGVG